MPLRTSPYYPPPFAHRDSGPFSGNHPAAPQRRHSKQHPDLPPQHQPRACRGAGQPRCDITPPSSSGTHLPPHDEEESATHQSLHIARRGPGRGERWCCLQPRISLPASGFAEFRAGLSRVVRAPGSGGGDDEVWADRDMFEEDEGEAEADAEVRSEQAQSDRENQSHLGRKELGGGRETRLLREYQCRVSGNHQGISNSPDHLRTHVALFRHHTNSRTPPTQG